MKRFTKLCLTAGGILLLIGIILAGVAHAMGVATDIRDFGQSPEEQEVLTFPADEIDRLTLSLGPENVVLKPTDGAEVVITYTPLKGYTYDHRLEASAATGKSQLTFTSTNGGAGFHFMQFSLLYLTNIRPVTVEIPEGLNIHVSTLSGDVSGSITAGDLEIATVSGDIELGDMVADNIALSTTSGDVHVEAVKAENFSRSTTSGYTYLDKLTVSGRAVLHSISGEITMERSAIWEDGNFQTTSGDIEITDTSIRQNVSASTTSGDVQLIDCNVREDVTVGTTSGDVEIHLTGNRPHRAGKLSATSGTIHVSGLDDSAEYAVNVQTTSGDITVTVEDTE